MSTDTKTGEIFSEAAAESKEEAPPQQMEASLKAMRRAVLALAFAAETSPAMRDDYNALSAAIEHAAEIEGEAA